MTGRLLLFDCGSRTFAIDFAAVGEVLDPFGEVFPVPFTPPWLDGCLSYKGNAAPIVNLATFQGEEPCTLSGYLVIASSPINLALRVEGPIRVISPEELDPWPPECELAEAALNLHEGRAELLEVSTLIPKLEALLRAHGSG